jgi:lipoate-protein ligase B
MVQQNRIGFPYFLNGSSQMARRTLTEWFCVDLPAVDYTEAWKLQGDLVAARKEGGLDKNLVLLLEHPPVFTLGRRGELGQLTVSEDFLKEAGISIIRVERGGHITFHGPGQLVVYPIVDLKTTRLGVKGYVECLEQIMIQVVRDWGINAERNEKYRGIWVDDKKMGSIGIAIRRGICFHGLALNVNLSLEPFQWINPCGLQDVDMTSMAQELGREVSMKQVRHSIKGHTEAIFDVRLIMTELPWLHGLLRNFLIDKKVGQSPAHV